MAVFAGDPLPEFGGMSHAYGATACETNANRVRSVVIEAPHCKELVDAGPMSLRRLEADEAGLRKLPIHGEKAGRGPQRRAQTQAGLGEDKGGAGDAEAKPSSPFQIPRLTITLARVRPSVEASPKSCGSCGATQRAPTSSRIG